MCYIYESIQCDEFSPADKTDFFTFWLDILAYRAYSTKMTFSLSTLTSQIKGKM